MGRNGADRPTVRSEGKKEREEEEDQWSPLSPLLPTVSLPSSLAGSLLGADRDRGRMEWTKPRLAAASMRRLIRSSGGGEGVNESCVRSFLRSLSNVKNPRPHIRAIRTVLLYSGRTLEMGAGGKEREGGRERHIKPLLLGRQRRALRALRE